MRLKCGNSSFYRRLSGSHFVKVRGNNNYTPQNSLNFGLLERAMMCTPANESRIRGYDMSSDAEVY